MKNVITAIVAALALFGATQANSAPVFQMTIQPTGGATALYNGANDPGDMTGAVASPAASTTYSGTAGNVFKAGATFIPGVVASFDLTGGQIKMAVGFGTTGLGFQHAATGGNANLAGSYTVSLSLAGIEVDPDEQW